MYFDSESFGEDIDHLKECFESMDEQLDAMEQTISTCCSGVVSPTLDYFQSSTKNVASNHEVLLQIFKNIQDYVEMVKQNYDH